MTAPSVAVFMTELHAKYNEGKISSRTAQIAVKYHMTYGAGTGVSFLFHGHVVPWPVGKGFCVSLYHAVGCNRLLLHDTKSQNSPV